MIKPYSHDENYERSQDSSCMTYLQSFPETVYIYMGLSSFKAHALTMKGLMHTQLQREKEWS